jgi:hypothetical protein
MVTAVVLLKLGLFGYPLYYVPIVFAGQFVVGNSNSLKFVAEIIVFEALSDDEREKKGLDLGHGFFWGCYSLSHFLLIALDLYIVYSIFSISILDTGNQH